jgi:hypothetical protein
MNRNTKHAFSPACEGLEGRQLLSANYLVNSWSGKVVDDPRFSKANGTQMIEYQPNGGTNQQWVFVRQIHLGKGGSGTTYEIRNVYSGKFLQASGTKVIQNNIDYSKDQQWVLIPWQGRDLIMNASDGLVLNVSSTANGANINLSVPAFVPYGSPVSELWTLAPVESPSISAESAPGAPWEAGWTITASGQGFTPNSLVSLYVDGLGGLNARLALGSVQTGPDGSFHNFSYNDPFGYRYNETGWATVVAVDDVTGQEATVQIVAFTF